MVSTSACHAAGRGSLPRPGTLLGIKTWLSTIRDCGSLCLSDETLKLSRWPLLSGVYMPGEVKYPTSMQ